MNLAEPTTLPLNPGLSLVAEGIVGGENSIELTPEYLKLLRESKFLSQKLYVAFALALDNQKSFSAGEIDAFCDRWQIKQAIGRPIVITRTEIVTTLLWLEGLGLGEIEFEQLSLDLNLEGL
jgi:hypothetical protein